MEQKVSCPGCPCSIHLCPPGSCELRSWHFCEAFGAGLAFGSCREMDIPARGCKRTLSLGWQAGSALLLESPSEEPRRGCCLITLNMGYLRHRLGLFSVP